VRVTSESHLDHGLSPECVAWILGEFADRTAFFLVTLELPPELEPEGLVSALYGPLAGDEPVPEAEVTYACRGARTAPSRLVARPVRPTRVVTVIAGPDGPDGAMTLYTAYGGPCAPREPGDPQLQGNEAGLAESRAFWALHALAL